MGNMLGGDSASYCSEFQTHETATFLACAAARHKIYSGAIQLRIAALYSEA